jgi:hypothetical protein
MRRREPFIFEQEGFRICVSKTKQNEETSQGRNNLFLGPKTSRLILPMLWQIRQQTQGALCKKRSPFVFVPSEKEKPSRPAQPRVLSFTPPPPPPPPRLSATQVICSSTCACFSFPVGLLVVFTRFSLMDGADVVVEIHTGFRI